jgi:sulfatase maturation enzyme AslB (radical SAM superfamily)
MSIVRDIKVLHLESTDVCQAACPLCARETDANFRKDQQHHLDMHRILQVFDSYQIAALDKMFMCGNYGDPAAGTYTLDIFQEFRKLNPNIVLGMNSNGALRNTQWWHQLGIMFDQPQDYVVFSIDGLEDTNHVYRKNVDWHKLMANAQAYISAGGSAHWDMLVYQHNQHQVDECKKLAQDMGFTWFRAKVSKRPLVEGLEFPVGFLTNKIESTNIDCYALKEQSVYIDAQGRISPCCWLGSTQTDFVTNFEQIQQTWHSQHPTPVCAATCGTKSGLTNFTNQWQQQIQF